MFKILIKHAWLSLRRAHYFQRSIGIKVVIGFVVLSLFFYINMLARLLPGLLEKAFPALPPHESFFSLLGLIFLSDLIIRLYGQKLASHKMTPYLHLPVTRKKLALYTIVRSWFSLFNIYLLVLFYPFFMRVLPQAYGMDAFWLTMAGLFLLSAVSHSVIMLSKILQGKGQMMLFAFIALASLFLWLWPETAMESLLSLGLLFMAGNVPAFLGVVMIIVVLQVLSIQNLKKSYSLTTAQTAKQETANGPVSRLLNKVPVYGPFWVLEWKLLNRNKRSRSHLYQWPLMIPLIILVLYFYMDYKNMASYYVFLLMYSGSFGFYHLQYAYSWESHFFDFLVSRQFDLKRFIVAKYLFYVSMAVMQFLVILPLLLIFKPDMLMIFLSLTLYSCGPVFAMLLYFGVSNSTRLDPNKRAHFNFEGTSGSLFITILMVFGSLIPMVLIGLLLPWGLADSIIITTSFFGLAFIAMYPLWVKAIEAKFLKNKYIKLEKFRQ